MTAGVAPDLWSVLWGVFGLDGTAFVDGVRLHDAPLVALLIVLIAGLSLAVGQSVVLFANRVKFGRFVFSLLVSALLFAFSYAFLAVTTWAASLLNKSVHITLPVLLIVLAFSYAPFVFSFLESLPYLGIGIGWLLRTWNLLAIVVGVGAVGQLSIPEAAALVAVGWLGLVVAQQTVGKPIVGLGMRIMNWVSGVRFIADEQQALALVQETAETESRAGGDTAAGARASAVAQPVAASWTAQEAEAAEIASAIATPVAPVGEAVVAPTSPALPASRWLTTLAGLLFTVILAIVVSVALGPLRHMLFGWAEHVPKFLRVPLDLAWLVVIALIVAGLLAPLQTLGWWAGWFGEQITPVTPSQIKRRGARSNVSRYIV